jgi:hypothetical protein
MKKVILIIGIAIAIVGCNPRDPKVAPDSKYVSLGAGSWFYERVYDGCEYIVYDRSMTHKGNCTNSIHVYVK